MICYTFTQGRNLVRESAFPTPATPLNRSWWLVAKLGTGRRLDRGIPHTGHANDNPTSAFPARSVPF